MTTLTDETAPNETDITPPPPNAPEVLGSALTDEATDEAPAEGPTHAPVPADVLAEAPRDDGLNLHGYYRVPAGEDGSTQVVKLDAAENARAVYEGKGYVFEGYAPD